MTNIQISPDGAQVRWTIGSRRYALQLRHDVDGRCIGWQKRFATRLGPCDWISRRWVGDRWVDDAEQDTLTLTRTTLPAPSRRLETGRGTAPGVRHYPCRQLPAEHPPEAAALIARAVLQGIKLPFSLP